ncbi:GNAT family N-acetyltransferase [Cellulomonas sp.]|uniref:GNAT family N-acetyltransferase n=1 Tax=Cellulomonas sp. TaxID=40001 RepID=UPI003BA8423D
MPPGREQRASGRAVRRRRRGPLPAPHPRVRRRQTRAGRPVGESAQPARAHLGRGVRGRSPRRLRPCVLGRRRARVPPRRRGRSRSQRRGIGQRLVEALVDEVRSAGCEWLHVDYEPHLEPFYRQCGFAATRAGVLRLQR